MTFRDDLRDGLRYIAEVGYKSWWFPAFGLILVGAFILTFTQHIAAHDALLGGRYSVVEGPVTDFKPMRYEGHGEEPSPLRERDLSYSDYVVVPGFNNSRSHGGPIDSGIYVRVTYSGSTILRLEDIAR